ncbi:hypothetical protein N0V84_004415 [Fusarium piperis]|uniref:HTH OST-type domain-containing protein n=1 Tax=Fusarium piperis TaxID=1435070 RepID=A0A9W9BR86_9HYPO|nr:hypothetical protein N0V84_004415 [Fusarium piperis]
MATDSTAKLAILIDADNASPKVVSQVLAEMAKYGTAFVKRAYGDWTTAGLGGWKDQLLDHSIQPIQQFSYTSGKNSTDSAMIIDAMDLLYSKRFDGFCLISSDSDFTRLASRIRESGLVVYGCGEQKTPMPFVRACDKFIYIENLSPTATQTQKQAKSPTLRPILAGQGDLSGQVGALLLEAVAAISDDDGWARLADVGNFVIRQHPNFDHRTYGFDKLNQLIAATAMFEIDRRIPGEGKSAVVSLRDKRRGC